MAPCHFLSEPWRFYTCGPDTKAKLCGLNEEKRAMFEVRCGASNSATLTLPCAMHGVMHEDLVDPNLALTPAQGVPEWLVVTMSSEHALDAKLGLEDHAAAACATQNFMLSLAGEGIGSKWMTGALGAPPEDVLAAVGAAEGEHLMGAIWYGYPAKELSNDAKAPPRKKGVEGVVTKLA